MTNSGQTGQAPAPKPKNTGAGVGCLAVIAVLAWVFVFKGGSASPSSTTPHATTPPGPGGTPAFAWIPSGFTATSDDSSVAWRWIENPTCSYSDVCWGIEAIAHAGCSSTLYMELSIMDSSGAAVDFTNDTVGAVRPDQHAKLIFDYLGGKGSKARLAKTSCY